MSFSAGKTCCGCAEPEGLAPQYRAPSGAEWDRAMSSGVLQAQLDAALAISQSASPTCAGFCPPSNRALQVALNLLWAPRANAALAPFGLVARVDAWEEASSDGSGTVPFLMIVFARGAPNDLAAAASAAMGAMARGDPRELMGLAAAATGMSK